MDAMDNVHDDMTFMPGLSSTCNFTALARCASTPFNPSAAPNLPAPPVSSIKPQQSATKDGPFIFPVGEPPHRQNRSGLRNTGSSFITSTSQHSQSQPESFNATHSQQETCTTHAPHLSPILEGSDEDARSSQSSIATTYSHLSAASGLYNLSPKNNLII